MPEAREARTIVLLCGLYFWFITPIVQRLVPQLSAPRILIYLLLLLLMAISTSRLHSDPTPDLVEVPVGD